MYVMHRLTTYMWSLCNIFLHFSTAITPFVAHVVQWACQFIVSSKHLNCTILTLFFQRDDIFYLLCTCAWRVLLLRNTQRQLWHLGWYICLSACVYVVNGITTPCLAKKIALSTPSTRVSLIRVEFESTHTEAGLFGVGGLVAWLEACVRIEGNFPQYWPQSDLSRFEPLVETKVVPYCFLKVFSRVCQANASRPACLTSLSFAVQNAFHGSQTSSHLFWLPSASMVNFNNLKVKPFVLVKSHLEASYTNSKKRPPDPVTQNKFRTVTIQRNMYQTSQMDGPYYTNFCWWIICWGLVRYGFDCKLTS